jgi:predicted methyltransferase
MPVSVELIRKACDDRVYVKTPLLLVVMIVSVVARAADNGPDTSLDQIIAASHRSAEARARDVYRHPRETLLFFGLRPDMHVVEVWPGSGWYTEILAPYLHAHGTYYAAHYPVDDRTSSYIQRARDAFIAKLHARPDLYDRTVVTAADPAGHVALAAQGSADLVLTFRNVHNWIGEGRDQAMFDAFYRVLKRGGVLGVVEHRARPGTTLAEMRRTGYVTEDYVIALAHNAGFRRYVKAEINANARDTKNYPAGVWTLPPTLRLGKQDRQKYLDIGESDRMTLKFFKD